MRCFDEFATHPLVLAVVCAVLGSPHVQLSSCVGINIGAGERAQASVANAAGTRKSLCPQDTRARCSSAVHTAI